VHIVMVRVRSVTTDTFPSEMLGQPSACDRHKVGTLLSVLNACSTDRRRDSYSVHTGFEARTSARNVLRFCLL